MKRIASEPELQPPSNSCNYLYVIFFITNILVNFDHGIMPAASKEIKFDLNITDLHLGLLGSVVYAGLLIGSIVASSAFMNFGTKKLIFFVIIAYALSLLLFLTSDRIILLGISRTLVGFFQVFLVIYFPVWVDLHGGSKQTMWLTFLQLGVPLGIFLGYIATSLYIKILGNYSFLTQIFLLTPCGLSLLLFDSSDLDVQMKQEEAQQVNGKKIPVNKQQEKASPSAQFTGRTTKHRLSIEPTLKLQRDHTFLSTSYLLFSNKIYLYTMLTLASLCFVVNGIQFWISDYMRTILKVEQNKVFTAFTIISLTAPTIGVLYGGIALDKVGGYAGKNALSLCLFHGILASCCAIPIPFLNEFKYVIILLWFVFFFGGSLMPAVTGLMLKSVPEDMRAFSNSQAQLFNQLLGYLPSPLLYGFVNNLSKNPESRYGMMLLMFWSLWGVIGLFLAKREKDSLNSEIHYEEEEEVQQAHQNENKRHLDLLTEKMRKFIKFLLILCLSFQINSFFLGWRC